MNRSLLLQSLVAGSASHALASTPEYADCASRVGTFIETRNRFRAEALAARDYTPGIAAERALRDTGLDVALDRLLAVA